MTKRSANKYAYGFHAVAALIRQSCDLVECIYIEKNKTDKRTEDLIQALSSKHIDMHRVSQDALFSFVGEVVHQGIVAKLTHVKTNTRSDLKTALANALDDETILILDGVHDPVNLGACLRVADAVGVNNIIIPKDKSAPVTPVVRKVAAGAAEWVNIHTVTNLARTIDLLKKHDFWVLGLADESAQSLYEYACQGRTAVILGNESRGLRQLTRQNCDHLLSIPMPGHVESLNVSVAAGITLYELYRQKSAQ